MQGRISCARPSCAFADPVRVSELRTTNPDKVRLPLRESPLREVRMADAAGNDQRDVDITFEQCAHVERETFGEGRVLDVVASQSRCQREVVRSCL